MLCGQAELVQRDRGNVGSIESPQENTKITIEGEVDGTDMPDESTMRKPSKMIGVRKWKQYRKECV